MTGVRIIGKMVYRRLSCVVVVAFTGSPLGHPTVHTANHHLWKVCVYRGCFHTPTIVLTTDVYVKAHDPRLLILKYHRIISLMLIIKLQHNYMPVKRCSLISLLFTYFRIYIVNLGTLRRHIPSSHLNNSVWQPMRCAKTLTEMLRQNCFLYPSLYSVINV